MEDVLEAVAGATTPPVRMGRGRFAVVVATIAAIAIVRRRDFADDAPRVRPDRPHH